MKREKPLLYDKELQFCEQKVVIFQARIQPPIAKRFPSPDLSRDCTDVYRVTRRCTSGNSLMRDFGRVV